jgi:hypothetical protein
VISVDPVGHVLKPKRVDCEKTKLNFKKRIVIVTPFKSNINSEF